MNPSAPFAAVDALSFHLYSLPSAHAASSSRRLRARSWLEAACASDGALTALLFCCSWSPAPVAFSIGADARSVCVLRLAESAGADAAAAAAVASRVTASLAQSNDSLLMVALARLSREVTNCADEIWGAAAAGAPSAPPSALPGVAVSIDDALCRLGNAAPRSAAAADPSDARKRALLGLSMSLHFLACAAQSARASIVCRPAPHWLQSGSSGAAVSFSTSASPHDAADDVDMRALRAAIAGVPAVRSLLACVQRDASDAALVDALGAIPADAVHLLFWLTVLAPAHLVALPGASAVVRGAVTFDVLHGPVGAGDALWDARKAAEHGTVRAHCLHGTASENVHAVLGFGLRVLSGTRHESSGSIFGRGVYLSADAAVAREFATVKGGGWGGWAWSDFHAIGGAGSESADAGGDALSGASGPVEPPAAAATNGRALARAVFEVAAIASPSTSFVTKGVRKFATEGSTPPLGAYIIVDDAAHMRVTRLHVWSATGDEDGGKVDVRRNSTCAAPWFKYVVGALIAAYIAVRLGALGWIGGARGGRAGDGL